MLKPLLFASFSLILSFCIFCGSSSALSIDTTRSADHKVTCRPLWDNKCLRHSDCCSQNCQRDNSRWEFGVCRLKPTHKNEQDVKNHEFPEKNSENPKSAEETFPIDCKELWFNRCRQDSDCCSENCERANPFWLHGVCKPKSQKFEETTQKTKFSESFFPDKSEKYGQHPDKNLGEFCKPLWFNECLQNSDCCSQNCERDQPYWLYGVCKTLSGVESTTDRKTQVDEKNLDDTKKFDPSTSEEIRTEIKACRELWFNKCLNDEDCCSENCHRGNSNSWLYGICKPQTLDKKPGKKISFRPTNRLNSVSFEEFRDAVTASGFPPPRRDQYEHFIAGLEKGQMVGSKREAAMMLAQVIHESGGLQFTEETRCIKNPQSCQWDYQTPNCDRPGKWYHGRGYLQLTWCHNYLAAGYDLGLGDKLVRNPDLVSRDDKMAWDVSFSYWKRIVHNSPGVSEGRFGATTNAINGQLECRSSSGWNWREGRSIGRFGLDAGQPADNSLANARFRIYTKVYRAFNLPGQPDSRGCSS